MTDIIHSVPDKKLENGSFDYSKRGDALELSKKHIKERLGGVLADGNNLYSLDGDSRYPDVGSLTTIEEKFNNGKIGLNLVPEGDEVKFRNAVLSDLKPPNLKLSILEVGPNHIDEVNYQDLSGVTVNEVNGQRGIQKYVGEIRFTRGFGAQDSNNKKPDISEGLLKSEVEVLLSVLQFNTDANRLTQGGNNELDNLMRPDVVIITPNPKEPNDGKGISVVMENTGVGATSYLKQVGILR